MSARRKPAKQSNPWSIRDLVLGSSEGRPPWLAYVRDALAIDPGGHPAHAYVGLNFTTGGVKNLKLYFAFFRRLESSELDVLLPVKDRARFEQFYAQWHPSTQMKALHRGVTFALKIDREGTVTHYWHMRIRGLPFGPPERLALQPSDRENFHGVCEEFTGNKSHLKRYFYLRHPISISTSLAEAGMPDRTKWVDQLEYIESDGRDKFSWVTRDPRLVNTLVNTHSQPDFDPVLSELKEKTGIGLYAPGSSRDRSDHALYLVNPEPRLRVDHVTTFLRDYVGLRGLAGTKKAARKPPLETTPG